MALSRTWLGSALTGVATALLGALLILSPVGPSFEEEVGLVWLFNVRGPVDPPPEVAVVAISGDTGRQLELPKMPRDWPRTMHATLLDNLQPRPAVTVFDMDFNRIRSAYEDLVMADALDRAGNVVLFERLTGKRQPLSSSDGQIAGWTWVEERFGPTPPLASSARGLAPFILPKTAAAAFQFWAFKPSGGDVPTVPAVALQMLALPVYERWLEILAEAGAAGLESLPQSAAAIREHEDLRRVMGLLRAAFVADPGLAARVRARVAAESDAAPSRADHLITALAALYGGLPDRYLNFYGPPGTIRTIPYEALARPEAGIGAATFAAASPTAAVSTELGGKTVFVGYSDLFEPDQPDRFYTVFTSDAGIDLSGVEIMATAFANLLTDATLKPLDGGRAALLMIVFGLLIGGLAAGLPALYGVPLILALTLVCAFVAQVAFDVRQLWLPVATPFLVQVPFALLVGLMGQYLLGRARQRQMSQAISHYLPATVVKSLTEGNLGREAVDRVVTGTCFANDMSGFSTLAEKMPPNELAVFMNAYFDALASALKDHQVDVTEFHADTIMSLWLAGEREAAKRRDALLAAVDAVQAIDAFARTREGLALTPRVGLQDGQVYLGHTGGGGRLSYSILGDPANTAARLESLNKYLGTHILAGASVVHGIDDILVRPLGRFRLKGRADVTAVVEVLDFKPRATPQVLALCARFAAGLEAFEAHDWAEARRLLEELLQQWPDDGPARFYLDLAQERASQPIEEGDPAIVAMDVK